MQKCENIQNAKKVIIYIKVLGHTDKKSMWLSTTNCQNGTSPAGECSTSHAWDPWSQFLSLFSDSTFCLTFLWHLLQIYVIMLCIYMLLKSLLAFALVMILFALKVVICVISGIYFTLSVVSISNSSLFTSVLEISNRAKSNVLSKSLILPPETLTVLFSSFSLFFLELLGLLFSLASFSGLLIDREEV